MILSGTGHRPQKLFKSNVYSKENFDILESFLKAELGKLSDIECIISGGALGFDQALAMAAIDLGIKHKVFIPCWKYEWKWPSESKERLHFIMRNSAQTVYVKQGEYDPICLQRRNEAMVDNSDAVLALFSGDPSGTKNCVEYARRKGKRVINIWESWMEWRS